MAGSCARLTPAEHLARYDGAYLGYVSPRAVLKCFDRAKVPMRDYIQLATTPYSWLMGCMRGLYIINNIIYYNAVPPLININKTAGER